MKTTRILIALFLVIVIIISLSDSSHAVEEVVTSRSGTAIIMTGAGARIPQQAALLEELYNRGLLKDVVFISGVSAGAINAVMLNGILSEKITWEEYKNILFNINDSDIFVRPEGRKLPVNTDPARSLFRKIAEERLGYRQIGDLPIMTEISFTSFRDLNMKKRVFRMCSRKINAETDTTLSIVDILMASTAIPVAFPPVRIENVKTIPDIEYIDGGVGADHVPFQALLDFERFRGVGVEKVYIISRKSASYVEISDELRALGIEDTGRLERIGFSVDNILRKVLLKRLGAFAHEAPELILLSYVWVPEFDKDFLMLNFNNLQEQYLLTQSWARNHDPVPLGDFLLYNKLKKRSRTP
jgi:hypothetical protein